MPFMPTVQTVAADAELDAGGVRRSGGASARFARYARIMLSAAVFCLFQARAGTTILSKSDMRLWQTVHDRSAPLEWQWEDGADSATLVFSNRLTRATSTEVVMRSTVGTDHRAVRGSCGAIGDLALPGGETIVDVTLVQTAGGSELARASATLAYVNGAGGGPVEVRALRTPEREMSRLQAPRVYAYDPAWRDETGDSGYDILWPVYRGLTIVLK